jgi:predicted DCC family thiol-disulfide oxidoreductase YuxK
MALSSDLTRNAIAYLQRRFPRAVIANSDDFVFRSVYTDEKFTVRSLVAQDPDSGIRQRAIVIPDLGARQNLLAFAHSINTIFEVLDSALHVTFSNQHQKGHVIDTTQMILAPKQILYTNALHVPPSHIIAAFTDVHILIDIITETDMYNTLFICYGDPDKQAASDINTYLKRHGIQTSFFPDDATPGEKLHRWMHSSVNNHDRVLLICSEQALNRSGVLNEIERVLEREAKEGGSTILMPITLDDYVYGDWAPSRMDVVDQVRARIIIKVDMSSYYPNTSNAQLDRLVKALAR